MKFKRNQVEEAIARTVDPGTKSPSAELLTRIKRLLDTDRALLRNVRSADPEQASYAFSSAERSGSGVEVDFSGYDVFALLTAVRLLEHGFPQRTSVRILRRIRTELEKEHTRILKMNVAGLFDQQAIQNSARPGQLASSNANPGFLVIETSVRNGTGGTIAVCKDERALMHTIKARLGTTHTIFEIVTGAIALHHNLSQTEPRQRGRSSK